MLGNCQKYLESKIRREKSPAFDLGKFYPLLDDDKTETIKSKITIPLI